MNHEVSICGISAYLIFRQTHILTRLSSVSCTIPYLQNSSNVTARAAFWWSEKSLGVDHGKETIQSSSGWCFGTWMDYFSIQLGMSSSQLTSCPSFFRGVGQPPTSKDTSYTGTSVSSHPRSVTTGTPSSSPSEVGSGEEEVGGFNEIHLGIQILSLQMEFNGDLLGFTGDFMVNTWWFTGIY